jgi:hypothetical protein
MFSKGKNKMTMLWREEEEEEEEEKRMRGGGGGNAFCNECTRWRRRLMKFQTEEEEKEKENKMEMERKRGRMVGRREYRKVEKVRKSR